MTIDNCYVLNGNTDISNEYRNNYTDKYQDYVIENITITNSTFHNYRIFSNNSDSYKEGEDFVARKNIVVKNCNIIIDRDIFYQVHTVDESIVGCRLSSTNLNNDEFIYYINNNIYYKGKVKHTNGGFRWWSIIYQNCKVNNLFIENNTIYSDFTDDLDLTLTTSRPLTAGFVTFGKHEYKNIVIKNNTIKGQMLGITFEESIVSSLTVTNNDVESNFLLKFAKGVQVENMDVSNNIFKTVSINNNNTVNNSDYWGYESFISWVTSSSNKSGYIFNNCSINNNHVEAYKLIYLHGYVSDFEKTTINNMNIVNNVFTINVVGNYSESDFDNKNEVYCGLRLGRDCLNNNNNSYVIKGNVINTKLKYKLCDTFIKNVDKLIFCDNIFAHNSNVLIQESPNEHTDGFVIFNNNIFTTERPANDSLNITNIPFKIYYPPYAGDTHPIMSQSELENNPLNDRYIGFISYNTDKNSPVWWTQKGWTNSDASPYRSKKEGTSSERPNNVPIGYYYFDTTLNKPIWAKNETPSGTEWIDATGTEV